ncbi:MAG: hypothetical protein ACRDSR_05060 [Pseudonocardiaceae bacterium]
MTAGPSPPRTPAPRLTHDEPVRLFVALTSPDEAIVTADDY